MCVLCVQWIGEYERQLQNPSTDEGSRLRLEELVKSRNSLIRERKAAISSIDKELAEQAAILNPGELPGCHADDC